MQWPVPGLCARWTLAILRAVHRVRDAESRLEYVVGDIKPDLFRGVGVPREGRRVKSLPTQTLAPRATVELLVFAPRPALPSCLSARSLSHLPAARRLCHRTRADDARDSRCPPPASFPLWPPSRPSRLSRPHTPLTSFQPLANVGTSRSISLAQALHRTPSSSFPSGQRRSPTSRRFA